jgi:uncharacterized membrane protein
METRSKIKLTLSSLDSKLESAGKIFLIILWALTLFVFLKLPATIPIHFNASGQADNYGSRMTILISPILATIIYFGLTQLNKYPHIFNYMVKITETNAPVQYKIATALHRKASAKRCVGMGEKRRGADAGKIFGADKKA